MIYPWQTHQWQKLWQAYQAHRLPHAFLFMGIAGIGKAQFADDFSRLLMCQKVNEGVPYACNQCHACRLVTNHTHPNVLWVAPEKQLIKIDQIREIKEFIQQSALEGGYHVAIINHANHMNINAANALLKTLEEPPKGALLMLLSDLSTALPATITSRCQRLVFHRPSKPVALDWLKHHGSLEQSTSECLLNMTDGAPLAALEWLQNDRLSFRNNLYHALALSLQDKLDPIETVAHMPDVALITFLDFMLCWISDVLRLQLGGEPVNQDFAPSLHQLKQRTDLKKNTYFMVSLQKLRKQVGVGVNLNKSLTMEAVLIDWIACHHVAS